MFSLRALSFVALISPIYWVAEHICNFPFQKLLIIYKIFLSKFFRHFLIRNDILLKRPLPLFSSQVISFRLGKNFLPLFSSQVISLRLVKIPFYLCFHHKS